MKFDGFSYKVSVEILFTEEEVDVMAVLAIDHYDRTCRLAAMPRDPRVLHSTNGMLNILKSKLQDARTMEFEPTPSSFTGEELNLLLKILEGRGFIRNNDKLFDKANKLNRDMFRAFKDLNDKMEELNRPEEKS